MKSITLHIMLAAALASPSYLVAAEAYGELSKLITSHPRIISETENLRAARSSVTQAKAGYLPRVDGAAALGYEDTDRTGLDPAGDDIDLNSKSASLTATQNLFEGFRTDGSIAAAHSEVTQAEHVLNATKQQILFEALSSYITVLRQVKLTELSKRNMATLQNQLELEDERVERGSGVAVDVLQAKSRLQISKERYTAFVGGLQEAIARYVQVFNHPPAIENMRIPALPTGIIPPTLDSALATAKAHSPTLKTAHANIDILDHQKTIAQANYYPTIDVVASSSYDDDVGGIRGTDISNSLVLRGNWNLYNGSADEARHEQSIAQHQSAIATGVDTERRVLEEVKLAWANLDTSKKRTDLLNNAVNIAGEVYDARKRLRDVGKDTALNVLDAENELFRAQIDAAAAEFDYYVAQYRLLLSTGQLTIGALKQTVPLAMTEQPVLENDDETIASTEIADTKE